MFYNCVNLEYNFNKRKLSNARNGCKDIFYNIKENVIICINEDITKEKILPQIKNIVTILLIVQMIRKKR